MQENNYNGWTNYETWCVNLWFTNDESTDRHWRDLAYDSLVDAFQEADESYDDSVKNEAINELADAMKQLVDEDAPEVTGMYADMMNSALSEVDWYEIAEHFVNDVVSEIDWYELTISN